MDSNTVSIESIRIAVCSPSTCTSATTALLTDLLLSKPNGAPFIANGTKKGSQSSVASGSRKTKASGENIKTKSAASIPEIGGCKDQLTPKERCILATEVINATLKTLSDAIKNNSTAANRRQAPAKEPTKTPARRALRRSNSLPPSPLQPRSLNRVISSPNITTRESRSSSSASVSSLGCRPSADCARLGFACLRTLSSSPSHGVPPLPPLQLENGMSTLVGKLISLGYDDLAIKELRLLKRRLEIADGSKSTASSSTSPSLAELIDFGSASFTGPKLNLVITTQLQALRLMGSARKPRQIEEAIETLNPKHTSSPTRLLLVAAKVSKDSKQTEKIIRQVQTLSEILLSLSPSISASEDALAKELRLSVVPEVAVKLQCLALHNRFLWWGLAGHQGDLLKDIFEPFLRCLQTFARRSENSPESAYHLAASAANDLQTLLSDCSNTDLRALSSTLSAIYRVLGSLSRDAGLIPQAVSWTVKVQKLLDPRLDSEAKRCSVIARLVSLKFRNAPWDSKDEELLLILLDALERPFRGESAEIDELMVEVSSARRFIIGMLSQYAAPSDARSTNHLNEGMRAMCEQLVFLCPRLCTRYLGNKPESKAAMKDILRYEQRRKFIIKRAIAAVDSTFFLIKMIASQDRSSWELVDSKLQDCLSLLDRLDVDSAECQFEGGSPPNVYYSRLSNLYYSQFLNMRKCVDAKDGQQIRALRRSLDSVRGRPRQERKIAQFSAKLERLAELYKTAGRYDELHTTLLTLRDEIVEDGALSEISRHASAHPIETAWALNENTAALGRVSQSLLKVRLKHLKPSFSNSICDPSWSIEERAAVLEHQLNILIAQNESDAKKSLLTETLDDLLCIYSCVQYPLRRLRVLQKIISMKMDDERRITSALDDIHVLTSIENDIYGTKDEGLWKYFCHLQTLAKTTAELRTVQPRIDVLRDALNTWGLILLQCQDAEVLQSQVDDVEGLVLQLEIIINWVQMKGYEADRVAALRLKASIHELCGSFSTPDDLVLSFAHLGEQWLHMGYSGKAGLALDRAKTYSSRNGVSAYAFLVLHLSYCEYLIAIGSFDKVEDQMACAQASYFQHKEQLAICTSTSILQQRTRMAILNSSAYALTSAIALEHGVGDTALGHAKQRVRVLRRAWNNISTESQKGMALKEKDAPAELDNTTEDLSGMKLTNFGESTLELEKDSLTDGSAGANFWGIITPLFRSLTHLATVLAHHGMFQETVYYAEQAYKLAKEADSESLIAAASILLGSTWLKAGSLDRGAEFLMHSKQILSTNHQSRQKATLFYHTGKMYGTLGDSVAEMAAYENAEDCLKLLSSSDYIRSLDEIFVKQTSLEGRMASMSLIEKKPATEKKQLSRARKTTTRKATAPAKKNVEIKSPVSEECPQLMALRAAIMRQKAKAFMTTRKLMDALQLLDEAENYPTSQGDSVSQGLYKAKQLLLHSFEQMHADPVYSVLQDSTISFPSVAGLSKEKHADRLSAGKVSPPKRIQSARTNKDRTISKSPTPISFMDKLRQAQDLLIDAHVTGMAVAPIAVVHNVSAVLNSVAILLSALNPANVKHLVSPGMAICSIETARTLALQRERKAILAEARTSSKFDETSWPQVIPSECKRSTVGYVNDAFRFQKDYLDIIPKSWTVVSIGLSDNQHELSITKMQAGQSPFVLRLPLGRHNSMDQDEEVFGYEEGHAELLEILELANESAHDARNRKGKEAKVAWWEEREALDARLRDLLENIEKVWLGGFTGIFSQHSRRATLLASFQKSFHNILDKHLPSRRKLGKRNVSPKITLDSRILDLFIGLGDASDEDCDLSEPLTDLLYFVIDVLQFHGELNAYAEIDFDSIVVDMHDALRGYHAAVRNSTYVDEGKHTILILDKALHVFPWESLPCMDGLAVSRLPSLGCLRDRILAQREEDEISDRPEGHYISKSNGAYILNPSGDLKDTQQFFEKSMQTLPDWEEITNRSPSEEEFKQNLVSKDLLLYFGHGSGAQYIRAREIKRLEQCAVTILMGCSSGAMIETGEFEPYGAPINYMHAGCPALVATLWDVTDRDIDRFAKSTFEHWGLLESEPEKAVKGKCRAKKAVKVENGGEGEGKKEMSLVEAVAKGRSACHLRYLNAASVVVYGIPVYFR